MRYVLKISLHPNPDVDLLNSKIAIEITKTITSNLKIQDAIKEGKAQQQIRFLIGRHLVWMKIQELQNHWRKWSHARLQRTHKAAAQE